MYSFNNNNKKSQSIQRNKKVRPIQRKKNNKSKEIVPEKDPMSELLDKDLKTIVLKMLKEPKEDMEKVKKMMYIQNGKVNKKKPKKKSKNFLEPKTN